MRTAFMTCVRIVYMALLLLAHGVIAAEETNSAGSAAQPINESAGGTTGAVMTVVLPVPVDTGNVVRVAATSGVPVMAEAPVDNTADRLRDELAAARQRLGELSPSRRPGSFEMLEHKAHTLDAMQAGLQEQEKKIAALETEVRNLKRESVNKDVVIAELVAASNSLVQAMAQLEETQKAVQETLRVIQLGKYEYYEVKPGDTCESIAAQPAIYNDKSRHVLIRQANRSPGLNLDRLTPGQVLIIPRYPAAEKTDI